MTVSVQVPVTSTIANGSTTVFPYSFKILAAGDLSVSLAGVKQTTGFTIAGVGAETGNITFSVAPANGVTVTTSRDPVLSRLTDYQQFGPWPATTLNKDFDSMWLALQAFENDALRALKLPVDTATDQLINFTPGERASSLISFDSNGNLNITPLSALPVTLAAGSFTTDTFSGNGVTVAFTMSRAPGIKGNTYVFVGGAYIRKDQYSISSTTITFNVAPATGANNIEVCQAVALIAGSPADDTVSVASLQAGALAATAAGLAKMAAGYFTASAEARAKFADGFLTVAKMSTTDVSPFSRNVLDDLDAPAWRATLGVTLATDADSQAFTANRVIDGAKLATALKGANQSLAANGYQKLPGGLIIQWGTVTNSATAAAATAVTYPIAFPAAAVAVSNTAQTINSGAYAWIDGVTVTGFNSRSSISNALSLWIAIGY